MAPGEKPARRHDPGGAAKVYAGAAGTALLDGLFDSAREAMEVFLVV
jgi:hypothetical protein